jgi:hypothetical protein
MPDPKKAIADLKAENKKLKILLKNAVQLLHQSKEIIQQAGKPPAQMPRKKTVKKKAKSKATATSMPNAPK